MVNNRKYSVLMYNIIEEYGSELIILNDKFIQKVAKIQKKFLKKEDCNLFIDCFCRDIEAINMEIQAMRDTPFDFVNKNQFLSILISSFTRFFSQSGSAKQATSSYLDLETNLEGGKNEDF